MRLEFTHPEFGRGGAHFAVGMDREIVLRQELGDLNTAIKLDQIPAAFGLRADAADRRMLRFVPAVMRFRRILRPGDELPSELVDGRPSWMPKTPRLLRAVRRLGTAIGIQADPAADEPGLAAAFEEFAATIRSKGFLGAERLGADDIALVASDAARVDWLCRAVIAVQQCLGDLVRTTGTRQNPQQAESARAAARGMRDAVVWASTRAMQADQIAADPVAAFRDLPGYRTQMWPLIAALRAFALDVEPLMAHWDAARARRAGPSNADFETLLRMVAVRWTNFDGTIFDLKKIRFGLPVTDSGTLSR